MEDMEDNDGRKDNAEAADPVKTASEYIRSARAFIRNRQLKQAYQALQRAEKQYPNHPLILSYCGWLQAYVDRKHQTGVATCRRAFVAFKTSDPHTAGMVYPVLYLNLGRALLAAGRKKEAVDNFIKGLKHDRSHVELKKEMRLLGTRKQPPLAFLSRSNPINKYIGLLLHRAR